MTENKELPIGDPAHNQEEVMLASDQFWEDHKTKIVVVAVLVVLALAAFIGWSVISQQQRIKAEAAFAAAVSVEDFQAVISEFPGTVIAANSELLLAVLQRDGDNKSDSIDAFRSAASQSRYPLAASGALGETELAIAGSPADAVALFKQLAADYPDTYVAPYAMLLEGETLLRQGKRDEAVRVFRRLAADYPNSTSGMIAARQAAALAGAQ